jgi:CPA2 family monovalent cation:H+ antiporter-2
MHDEPSLISTIAIGLTLAFIAALIVRRLGLPSIVGYLLAGIVIGPFTPGFVADQEIASELAEIGVILLMFGVGINFSVRDLLAVRGVAVPGALGRAAVITALGTLLGIWLGWGLVGGVMLGLAVSVASTVVLLRALAERNELETRQGVVAVGWLIVEDIFTVIVLVLLPGVGPLLGGVPVGGSPGSTDPLRDLVVAVAGALIFVALMIGAGTRVVPAVLRMVAREGSRELFTLGVLALALGIAYLSSALFGVSLALGAFLAGVVVGESDVSHQAAAEALPLRDAFAVLFFVSIGMLVDPTYLVENWVAVAVLTAIVVGVKAVLAFVVVTALREPPRVGVTVAAGSSQIGEFSFILATVAVGLGLMPAEGIPLIAATAVVSIVLNPLAFRAVDPFVRRIATSRFLSRAPAPGALGSLPDEAQGTLRGHAVICGYGRVGRMVASALERRQFSYVVIDDNRRTVERLRAAGVSALFGDAANEALLRVAGIDTCRVLIAAMRDPQAVRLIIERAARLNSRLPIVARIHSDRDLDELGPARDRVQPIYGELELAVQMTRSALRRFGVSMAEAEAIAQGLRARAR